MRSIDSIQAKQRSQDGSFTADWGGNWLEVRQTNWQNGSELRNPERAIRLMRVVGPSPGSRNQMDARASVDCAIFFTQKFQVLLSRASQAFRIQLRSHLVTSSILTGISSNLHYLNISLLLSFRFHQVIPISSTAPRLFLLRIYRRRFAAKSNRLPCSRSA
jgi:hypothetical protein